MKFENKEYQRLYDNEIGKLFLEFPEERYKAYVEVIKKTPEYNQILLSVPEDLNTLEKVYYIYNRLGLLLFENNDLVYNHINNIHLYFDIIQKNGIGNCRHMSELFVSMLKYLGLIDAFYLTRKPVGVELLDLRHIDTIILIDGKYYLIDLIRDTVNMRAGIRNQRFGYIDSKEKRINRLVNFINSNVDIPEYLKQIIIGFIYNEEFEHALDIIQQFELNNNINIGSDFLKNQIPKIYYIKQIEEKIGKLEEVSIEYLDMRIGRQNIYFEDILQQSLIPRLIDKDSTFRNEWAEQHNRVVKSSKNSDLELDVDIIIDFISTISPNINPEILLKYLKMVLSQIYCKRYNDMDYYNWTRNSIKIYRVLQESDLELNSEHLPLETYVIIRKFNPQSEKEKYICYRFNDINGILEIIDYSEMISDIKRRKLKIKPKFSGKCIDSSDELEI